MIKKSEQWLTENEVVTAVAEHLQQGGWRITDTRTTSQQGVDISAERDGVVLAVEAKGGGSSKPHSSKYGKPFSNGQKRSHVAVAVLTALAVVSQSKQKAAIALPGDIGHLRLLQGIAPALQTLDIEVYLVADDRSVKRLETAI